jgi:hypothetical protein
MEFAIGDLFAYPVLTDLARKIDSSAPTVLLPITRARRGATTASTRSVITAVGFDDQKIASRDVATRYDLPIEGSVD